MFCPKCGTEVPDGSAFCMKCGASLTSSGRADQTSAKPQTPVFAPAEAKVLKCPSCGAPISPKFGEMVISCEYCGSSIALSSDGWRGIQKQSMLPIVFGDQQSIGARVHELMDRGLLHRHLQEGSELQEMNLSLVPYWIVSVSARTSIVASDVAVEAGQIATTAALIGIMGGALGGRRGGFGGGIAGPVMTGAVLGSMMGPRRGGATKSFETADNYNFPIVALKGLFEHQPRDYRFNLEARTFFDAAQVPKDVKILNGDVGQEAAEYQAKALVTQLQSEKAHSEHHMIQQLHTEVDVGDSELLYAPIWFIRYDQKGRKISLVIDANSGGAINSIGLE